MKRLVTIIAILLAFAGSMVAQTITIGTGTSTQRYPLGNYFGYERSASIYTAAEITMAGSITRLDWYATIARTSNTPIKIYLIETTSTTLTSVTWATMITGATLVYDAINTSITANAWNQFVLSTSFTYGGVNNLLVLVEANYGGSGNGLGSSGTGVRYSTATSQHEYWQADGSIPTGNGTVTSNRPNIQITLSTGPMTFASATTLATTAAPVLVGAIDQPVIVLQVVTTGSQSPFNMTAIDFTTTGTTSTSDLTAAKVYYTTSNTFSTTTAFGSIITNPSGTLSFTGSQVLNPGNSYFWLCYDISGAATEWNVVDGTCTQFTTSEPATRNPTVTDPAGSRTIRLPLSGTYTIDNTIPTGGTNYISFTDATNDLNSLGTSGAVTFNVTAGQSWSKTVPAAPYNYAYIVYNHIGTVSNPVVFQKSGEGANPVLSITGSSATTDIGFFLYGCDYVTFNGINITDAGTTSSDYLDRGYLLQGPTDNNCNHVTIQNSTIDLNKDNVNSKCIYGFPNGPTSAANTNRDNTFSGNTFQDTYNGIYLAGVSATYPDENNVISGNSVQTVGNALSTAVYAIYLSYQKNFSVSGNIISLLSGSGAVNGIYFTSCDGANNLVTNNTISSFVGTSTSSVMYGIYYSPAATATTTFSGNTIYGLDHKYNVHGLYIGGGTQNNIFKNKIYNVAYTGTSSYIAYGLNSFAGTTNNIYNNFIYDIKAPASTTTPGTRALNFSGGTTANVYFNTVYLDYTSTVASNQSAALYVTTSPTTLNMSDNIFVNLCNMTVGTRAVAFYKSTTALTNIAATNNNNLYYCGTPSSKKLIYYDGTNKDSTLAQYKARVTPRDANAMTENPPFVSAVSPYDLHMLTNVTTQCESGGITISTPISVTDDYDAEARYPNGGYPNNPSYPATAPDIGADEFAGQPLDINPPNISYTPLINTTSTSNRSFTNVAITDPSGVNVTAGTMPRVYFKRKTDANTFEDNTSATNGWKYIEANGTTTPFDFTIDYSLLYAPPTGVSTGDTVQYFVVAQDQVTPANVGINSGVFAAQPASVALTAAAFPVTGTINYYRISPSISGNFTVGTAGDYPSLTGPGGLFADINAKVLTGSIVATIISDLSETGANALNQFAEEPAGSNFTITFQPDGSTMRTISGTYTGGLIRLNGADRIAIDGRSGGDGQYLTFANNATSGSVFQLISLGANAGATGNTIRNCIMNMGGNGSGTYGISVGGASNATTGADNDNNTIRNNSISKAYVGIWAQGTVTTNPGVMDNLQVIGNTLGSATLANYLGHDGIIVGYGTGCSVSQNTVYNIITTNNTPVGITASTGFISSAISRNSMHDITYTGTGGYGGRGMYINTGNASSNLTIDNNLIYLIGGDGWTAFANSSMTGIYCDGTMGGVNIYYNSIYMSGDFTRASATLTTAMLFNTSTITNITLKNNIFQNSMNNIGMTTDKNYAIYSTAPATSFTSIDYNDYHVTGAEGFVGYLGSDRLTLADWQAASLQDANSISADPLFLGTADLNIPSNSPVIGEGTPITGLDYDYANADRDDVAPSIGAYEGGLVITCPAPTDPETSVITSSGATMEWIDPTGTTWDLYIVTAGSSAPDESTTPTVNNTNSNPYEWTEGDPATSYEWYVRTDCGGDDVSDVSFWTSPEPFTTECEALTTPYSQTFPTTSIPNCWSMSGPQSWLFTTTWPDYGADTVTDHTTGEGTYFAGVDGSGTVGLTGITLVTSFFDVITMSNPQLRFFMFNNNTSSTLLADEQSLRIDLWDGAAWQNSIFFWDFGQNASTWQEQIVNLGAYTITGDIQLRFVVDKGTGSPYNDDLIIDDLFIEEGASCPPPTALNATEESTITANLVWTAEGAETEWEYAYGMAPFAEPTSPGTVTSSNTDNVVSGLTSNTDYEFWVRAVCGEADTSVWAGPHAFTTLCDPFTDLDENFDAVTAPALPDCWSKYTSPSYTLQTVTTYATGPYSSPNSARLYNSTATLPADAPMLITPQLSNLGDGTYRLHFFAKGAGTNLSVVVGTMSDPANGATFTSFQTVSGLNTTTYTECVVSFSTYSGTDEYIAFQHPMTASSSYIYLDDILWEPIPDCAEPINLTVNNINSSGADLGWYSTGSETTWNVEVGLPGFVPGTDTEEAGIQGTGDNPWTVEGLAPSTAYEFYVQSDCGYQFVDPRVDHFWMAQDEGNNLIPENSGGTMNDPEEDGTWNLYDQTGTSWYNIWFYDGVLDINKVKLVRMGFWVQRLNNEVEANFNYVVNWSTPEWQDPGYPGPSQEAFIMRSPVNGPIAVNAYDPENPNGQWIELEYLIQDFNPEWVSVDIWGSNILIPNLEIAPPVSSPLRDWWVANPGPGGIIVHDCLPEGGGAGAWAGPKSFETLQQPATLPFAENFETWPNNWTVVNGMQANQWFVGTAAFYEGAQAAYVSNDGGLTNTYTITETVGSTVHLYRDISFTGGTGGYILNFRWKGQGEGATTYFDYLRAYVVDVTTTPVAGTLLSSGQVGVTYNLQANWTEATVTLPASLTGSNKRLVLTWRNDNTLGTQPPAAVDNISVFVAPFVWSGSTSTSWNDPTNWINGVVPDASSQVIIPTDPVSNPDRFPVIAAGETYTCDKVDVGAGAVITVQAGGTLNITNP